MRDRLSEKLYVDEIMNIKVRKNNMMGDLRLMAKYYNDDTVAQIVNEFISEVRAESENAHNKVLNDIAWTEKKNKKTIEIIYPKVIQFAKDNYKGLYDPDIHDAKIKKMVNYYGLQKLYIAPEVSFTKNEIDKINALKEPYQENLQQRKLAFMLLLLAKIKGKIYNKKYYVLDNEWAFWKFAGLDDLTKDKRNELLKQLQENELIKQTRLHDKNATLSIEVLFVDSEVSDIELTVTDYAYPQHIFLKYLKKKFIECEKCAVEILRKSNSQKFCKACSTNAKKESTRASMIEYRKNKSDKVETAPKAI